MSNKLFFDANILLTSVLVRDQKVMADQAIRRIADDKCISSLTGHLVVHFGKKDVNMAVLAQFLSDFTMLPLEQADFDWAFTNCRNNDFEDALQLAVAIRHGCDEFVTFDKRLYETYKSLPQLTVTLA